MRVRIQKLGRIAEAEFDLRPLTVFVGPNGTNKTWTAYALYSLWKEMTWLWPAKFPSTVAASRKGVAWPSDSAGPSIEQWQSRLSPLVKAKVAPLLDTGVSTLGVEFTREELRGACKEPIWSVIGSKALSKATGESLAQFEETSVGLQVEAEYFQSEGASRIDVFAQPDAKSGTITIRGDHDVSGVVSNLDDRDVISYISSRLELFLYRIVRRAVPFPAERKLLTALPFEQSWLPPGAMPTPLQDFLQFMAGAPAMASQQKLGRLGGEGDRYCRSILGGQIIVVGDIVKSLMFSVGDKQLSLAASASLVRAMAGLDLYVRYYAAPGDVIVIDELEMNAHPRAQLALVELVAWLVNSGVRVLLTTHSPYVVDHLNNLLEAARVPAHRSEALAQRFELKTPGAFLSADKVAVYRFEEVEPGGRVEVRSSFDPADGLINQSTFGPVSDKVGNLLGQILEASEE